MRMPRAVASFDGASAVMARTVLAPPLDWDAMLQGQPLRFEAPLLHPLADRGPLGILALAVRLADEGRQICRLPPEFDFAESFIGQPLVVRAQSIGAGYDGDDGKDEDSVRGSEDGLKVGIQG